MPRRVDKKPAHYLSLWSFAKQADRTHNTVRHAVITGLIPDAYVRVYKRGKKDTFAVAEEALDDYIKISAKKSTALKKAAAERAAEFEAAQPDAGASKVDSLSDARLAKEKLQVTRQTLELQKARGEVITVKRAQQLYERTGIALRQAFLAMTPRLTPRLMPEMSAHQVSSILNEEIDVALQSLHDLDEAILNPGGQ